MIAALLLAAAAVICAGLALQYAWVFYGGLRKRHARQFDDVSLFGASSTILALNDADIYASWRLARMNLLAAIVLLAFAAALSLALRR
jgi:intracellular septation protein A